MCLFPVCQEPHLFAILLKKRQMDQRDCVKLSALLFRQTTKRFSKGRRSSATNAHQAHVSKYWIKSPSGSMTAQPIALMFFLLPAKLALENPPSRTPSPEISKTMTAPSKVLSWVPTSSVRDNLKRRGERPRSSLLLLTSWRRDTNHMQTLCTAPQTLIPSIRTSSSR